jgi:predicted Zn-dependent protease with MMP-like domain
MKIKEAEFRQLAENAFSKIPLEFRKKIDNLHIIISNKPKAEDSLGNEKRLKALLGIYKGVPLRKRGVFYSNVLSDRIVLFKDNIENQCQRKEELEKKIEEVLVHEIGHHFGLSEKEIRNIERTTT